MTSPAAVRRATEGDLADLAAVESAAMPDPWSRAQLAGELGLPAARLWVAAAPGVAVCGYAAFRLLADEGELLRVAVLPAVRRQGVAGALLAAAEAALAREGARRLHLEVRAANEAARRLYEGRGWRLAGRRRAYYRDGADALLYALALAAAE